MSIPENILNTLTDEQKKKVEAAKSPEELLSLSKEAGYELSQEQLSQVSGGLKPGCPQCRHDDCPYDGTRLPSW